MAAITQISRIQHRSGLFSELPNALNEAEFGFALDTRQVFIGNGPIHPGNTEIMTQYTPASSYAYSYRSPIAYQQLALKGAPIGNDPFTASTGFVEDANNFDTDPSTFNATIRSFQEKFDEIVSVKDYKAIGDGEADDTGALVRATRDLFSEEFGAVGSSDDAVKRNVALYLPGGVYRIRQNIVGFPNMTLIGDPGKTVIYLDVELSIDDNDDAVLISGDSYGQIDGEMGLPFGDNNLTPSILNCDNMHIYGIEFRSNQIPTAPVRKRQVVRLSRTTNAIFEKCAFNFVGTTWTSSNSIVNATSSVILTTYSTGASASQACNRIKFIDCSSSGAAHDFNVFQGANNISVERHLFGGMLLNSKVGYNATYDVTNPADPAIFRQSVPTGSLTKINMSNSVFNNYTAYAIDVFNNASGVTSFGNRFNSLTGKSIRFGSTTQNCSSMSDWFANSTSTVCGTANPRIDNNSATAIIFNAQDFVVLSFGIKDLRVCGTLTIDGSLVINPPSVTNLTLTTVAYPNTTITQPNSAKGNSVIVNYAMRIPATGGDVLRTGTLKVIYFETSPNVVNAGNISVSDDYVEIGGTPGIGSGLSLTVTPNNTNQNIEIKATSSIGTPTSKVVVTALII